MDSWKFRDELFKSLNQWYLILGFILIGGGLGFAISYLMPAPYQAVTELYIGIDVERVNKLEYIIPIAETEPLNLDDYKNWQLKQVADILKSENVLNKTLLNLSQAESGPDDLTLGDLRKSFDIYWYDTGIWRLEAVQPEKDQAVEILDAWKKAGHEEISRLLQISKTGNAIDQEIWSYNLAISEIKLKRTKYQAVASSCADWITKLSEFSGTSQLDPELYSDIEEWAQLQIETASFSLDAFFDIPAGNESVAAFIAWFTDKENIAENAVEQLTNEKLILEEERDQKLPEFYQYLDDSLGLSANLVLLPNNSDIDVRQIYSTGRFAVGGSLLGFLTWIIFTFVRISSGKEDHGN